MERGDKIRSSQREQRLLTYLHADKPLSMQIGSHFYQECKKPIMCENDFESAKIYGIEASCTTARFDQDGFASLSRKHGTKFSAQKNVSALSITTFMNHFERLPFPTLIWKHYRKGSAWSCEAPWQSRINYQLQTLPQAGKELLAQKPKQQISHKISERGENKGCIDCASLKTDLTELELKATWLASR